MIFALLSSLKNVKHEQMTKVHTKMYTKQVVFNNFLGHSFSDIYLQCLQVFKLLYIPWQEKSMNLLLEIFVL